MAIVTSKALLIAKLAFMMAVAGHYRGIMADLNFHHHNLLHSFGGSSGSTTIPLRPGELPGGLGLPASALLGSAASGGFGVPGLTQAFSLQSSPFGLGNSLFQLKRS
ncbi:Hypothetical protein NTJ_08718 [Nesidiocoris tenuis]|uniref:OAR domain-containing protein n=1 Tax=Nesidiocoris tenuis TaxID=355587 RepID=A0ABN7AX86_9HEMI|nr:Hypothetical protein NTJ_08718 [Nesidiocoris tenuis]